MAEKSRISKVSQRVLTQARESFKLLETLEKETLAKARTFVRNPIRASGGKQAAERLANDKLVATLKSLGIATRTEIDQLSDKVRALETELTSVQAALERQGVKRATKAEKKSAVPSAEAFPNT